MKFFKLCEEVKKENDPKGRDYRHEDGYYYLDIQCRACKSYTNMRMLDEKEHNKYRVIALHDQYYCDNCQLSGEPKKSGSCDPGFYQCAHGVSVALPCLQCKEGIENAVIQKEPPVEMCKHESVVAWCSACSSILHNFIPDKPLFGIRFRQPKKNRTDHVTLGISKKSIGDSITIGDRVTIKILDFVDERFFIEISMQDHLTYLQNNHGGNAL